MTPVNEDEREWSRLDDGNADFDRKRLTDGEADDELGCSLYRLPPGGSSWPYHYHAANEEAMYVLSGYGTLRTGGEEHDLRAGDFVRFPVGEEGGHRIVNDGDEPLRYLMVSTMHDPDVTVYPDSGKFGVYAGSPPGGRDERDVHGYYPLDGDVDYWEGE